MTVEDIVESGELCSLLLDLSRHRRAGRPLDELLPVVRASDLLSERPIDSVATELMRRIREIGEAMHQRGGMPAMMAAYRWVRSYTAECERLLDKLWNGVGHWAMDGGWVESRGPGEWDRYGDLPAQREQFQTKKLRASP